MLDGVSVLGFSGESVADYATALVGAYTSFVLCQKAAVYYWDKFRELKVEELPKEASLFTWDRGGRMTKPVYLTWRAATVVFLLYIVASLIVHVHYLVTPKKCFGAVSNLVLSAIEILDGLLLLVGFLIFIWHVRGDLFQSLDKFAKRIRRMWKRIDERAGGGQVASSLIFAFLHGAGVAAAPLALSVGTGFASTYIAGETPKQTASDAVISRVACACTNPSTQIANPRPAVPMAPAEPAPKVAEATPQPAEPPSSPLPPDDVVSSNEHHVLFDFDSSQMTPSGQAELSALAEGMPDDEPAKVVGHSDTYGSAAHNLTLSKRRAETTAEALRRLGVNVDSVIGVGENDLPVKTADGVKEPMNRQTTVTVGKVFHCSDGSTCPQFDSCKEAMWHLKVCNQTRLDGDHDGVPCEKLCKKPTS